MKKTSLAIACVLSFLALASCGDSGFKRTKSGLMYKIISDNKNPVVKPGQILKLEFEQKVHDSLLFSSKDNGPAYGMVDSNNTRSYDPTEIFGMLRKGDSAVVIMEADTIRRKRGGELPPFLTPKDKIVLGFRVADVFNTQEEASADQKKSYEEYMKRSEAESEVQKEKDIKTIEDWCKSKNISVEKAPKGTLVHLESQGNGAACDSGKFVSVMYTGKTFEGEAFDSNIDPKFQHAGQPFTLQIGVGGAIQGWDDGLRLFKEGGKGTLYIPSSLAYGKQGRGDKIKPNANLIFDVEVVKVSDSMPRPQTPPQAPGK
jgi:FKBP-type peptidyl-prolyl cis-trans isomerase